MSALDKATIQTLAQIKQSLGGGSVKKATTVTTANNLAPYDLQAPAKNLYPVYTPIRNKLPRRQGVGNATNWREIAAIVGSGMRGMGWVAEGNRAAAMTIVTNDRNASFKTLGEESSITFEGANASIGFDDERANNTLRALQSLMLKEETAIIGGNASLALGTTPTPTSSTATAAGATINATTSTICVAMTAEGYANIKGVPLSTGITQTLTVTGQDGKTYVVNGGYAQQSAAKSQAVTTGNSLTVAVAPVKGAYAYAWYVGTAGAEKLEAITTVAQATFTALAGTGQAASSLTAADYSRNANVAFDGFLSVAANNSTAYFNALANGSTLTSSNRGSVKEIDTMLNTMWDNYQVSPSALFVASQQLKNITDLCMSGGTNAPLVRYVMDNNGPAGAAELMAGQVVASYLNPYQAGGAVAIPIILHPTLPAGTILGWADTLPIQYQNSNVPNVAEIVTRMDYYQIDWPQVTREYRFGVYTEEVLAVYAPLALGVITNITPN